MISNKRGFTLVELMVVVAIIAILMAALSFSVSAARERARIQKAHAEVKSITQAILGYENYAQGYTLPTMVNREIDSSSFGFLLGKGGASSASGGKIPVILMASLQAGGKMKDPWGTPYRVTIRKQDESVSLGSGLTSMYTGYYLPNFYRLSKEERGE